MRRALLTAAAVTALALARAAARPPSRPTTPGGEQTGSTPSAAQPSPTPNSSQSARTPNSIQTGPPPNAFFGGVVPSQPAAVSTFTLPGSTVTITEFSPTGVRVSSVPPGGQAILPLEMQR